MDEPRPVARRRRLRLWPARLGETPRPPRGEAESRAETRRGVHVGGAPEGLARGGAGEGGEEGEDLIAGVVYIRRFRCAIVACHAFVGERRGQRAWPRTDKRETRNSRGRASRLWTWKRVANERGIDPEYYTRDRKTRSGRRGGLVLELLQGYGLGQLDGRDSEVQQPAKGRGPSQMLCTR